MPVQDAPSNYIMENFNVLERNIGIMKRNLQIIAILAKVHGNQGLLNVLSNNNLFAKLELFEKDVKGSFRSSGTLWMLSSDFSGLETLYENVLASWDGQWPGFEEFEKPWEEEDFLELEEELED